MVVEQTLRNPALLRLYKTHNQEPSKLLNHKSLSEVEGTDGPDWDRLLKNVVSLPSGNEHAYGYENAIEALLSAMFYPALVHPKLQTEIHDGRKRVDITYTNMGNKGFFSWLSRHYPTPHIFFECKNYGNEIGNPELDQISGRFSPSRGQFGIIVCRKIADRAKFVERCRDTAKDHRGYVIALEDADLIRLTEDVKGCLDFFELPLLKERFDRLVF